MILICHAPYSHMIESFVQKGRLDCLQWYLSHAPNQQADGFPDFWTTELALGYACDASHDSLSGKPTPGQLELAAWIHAGEAKRKRDKRLANITSTVGVLSELFLKHDPSLLRKACCAHPVHIHEYDLWADDADIPADCDRKAIHELSMRVIKGSLATKLIPESLAHVAIYATFRFDKKDDDDDDESSLANEHFLVGPDDWIEYLASRPETSCPPRPSTDLGPPHSASMQGGRRGMMNRSHRWRTCTCGSTGQTTRRRTRWEAD